MIWCHFTLNLQSSEVKHTIGTALIITFLLDQEKTIKLHSGFFHPFHLFRRQLITVVQKRCRSGPDTPTKESKQSKIEEHLIKWNWRWSCCCFQINGLATPLSRPQHHLAYSEMYEIGHWVLPQRYSQVVRCYLVRLNTIQRAHGKATWIIWVWMGPDSWCQMHGTFNITPTRCHRRHYHLQ